jgi:WD40 repeat protein
MPKIETHTWSPDGKKIATGSQNNTAHIWDSSTGKLLFTLNEDSSTHRGRQSPVLVVWSPDGTQVASKSHDTMIRIWDPVTAQCKLTLTRDDIMSENNDYWEDISLDSWGNEYYPDYMASTITWSPDASQIVCCGFDDDYWKKIIRVWDLQTGTCLFSCQVDPKPSFLQFDKTPNQINTSWGVLDFGCPVLDATIEPFTVHCSESGPSGYNFCKDYL